MRCLIALTERSTVAVDTDIIITQLVGSYACPQTSLGAAQALTSDYMCRGLASGSDGMHELVAVRFSRRIVGLQTAILRVN